MCSAFVIIKDMGIGVLGLDEEGEGDGDRGSGFGIKKGMKARVERDE